MPRVCTRCCKAIAFRTWSNDAITLLIAEKPHERWGTTPQEPAPVNQRAESLATVKSDSSTEIRAPESWQSARDSRLVVCGRACLCSLCSCYPFPYTESLRCPERRVIPARGSMGLEQLAGG